MPDQNQTTTTNIENTFICDCRPSARSACQGEPFFKEHEGKRYCVLHYPDTDKLEAFRVALKRKIEAKDFDFQGVWFSEEVNFNKVEFTADANFYRATFSAEADFNSATFSAEARFNSATFSAGACFDSTTFSADACFDSTTFSAEARFHSATFSAEARFHSATFSAEARFNSTTFSANALFSFARFSATANFHSTTFSANAFFNGARFSAETNFDSVTFSAEADFNRGKFSAETSFNGTTFSAEANFNRGRFSGKTIFDSARFSANANFYKARFSGNASFNSATFSAEANFSFARFSATANFHSTTFSAEANFRGAIFSAVFEFDSVRFSADFNRATFSGNASFNSATFSAEANFYGATFSAEADFNSATFKSYVRFAESKETKTFGEKTRLNLQFTNIEKPERVSFHTLDLKPTWFINADCRKYEFTDCDWNYDLKEELEEASKAKISPPHRLLAITYRQLADNAEANHRYHEASNFRYNAFEARRIEKFWSFVPWRLDWWYWLASGYGESVGRAFLVFVALFAVFAFGYGRSGFDQSSKATAPGVTQGAPIQPDTVGKPLDLRDAFIYSFYVTILQKPEPKPLTRTAKILVGLETVLGPAQAALRALAVRRRFMR